jgi:hypothetical protein
MRIGISYSGITGRNGADFVAKFLWRAAIQEGHQVFMIGSEGGPQAQEIPTGLHCVIHSSGFALKPALVEAWKKQTKVFVWDHNCEIEFWKDRLEPITKLVDRHFSYSKAQPFGDHVVYLPLAADEQMYKKLGVAKKYDVSMLGAPHGSRVAFAKMISSRFPNSYFGFTMGLSDEEVNQVLNETRVVLGPGQDADQYNGFVPVWGCPCRSFDVPAAGSYHLQVMRDGLLEVFSNRTNLGLSTVRPIIDMEQMAKVWIEKIELFLQAESWREEIANSMAEEVRSKHLYRHRLKRMIEFL